MSALTLALGIGAGTAIFSAVNPILFEPLPYPHPERIVMVWDIFAGARSDVTFHSYRELAARNHSFEAMAVKEAQSPWQPTMTGAAQPERFAGQSVSATYFHVLGAKPALGRDFQEADDRVKGPHVVILSNKLWRRRFNADRAILGRPITLDGDPYTVIGIMPKGFDDVLAPSAELWSPLQFDTTNIGNFDAQEWGHHLHMVGRLRPGVGVDAAQAGTSPNRARAHGGISPAALGLRSSKGSSFILCRLKSRAASSRCCSAVLGAVALLLLIACVNVTNLLLARGAQRRGEYAMRAALGAGRSRLIRQLLTESVLLALIGGALGIVAAEFGVRALAALSPPGLPRVDAITVNGAVFAFAFAITTVIGLLVGLVPALHASSGDLPSGLQQTSQRTVGSHQWTRRALVVAEVALALVLLASAGLVLRSLERLFAVSPGFDASNLLTMQVRASGHRFADDQVARQFFAQALEEVSHVPGVDSAAFTSLLPLSGGEYETYGASFEPAHGHAYDAFRYVITPEYFQTMGIALRRGRLLDAHDDGSRSAGGSDQRIVGQSRVPGSRPCRPAFAYRPTATGLRTSLSAWWVM